MLILGCAGPCGPAGDPFQERAEGEEPLQRGWLQDALAEVWRLPLCQGQKSTYIWTEIGALDQVDPRFELRPGL